jgi:hypothetical protein
LDLEDPLDPLLHPDHHDLLDLGYPEDPEDRLYHYLQDPSDPENQYHRVYLEIPEAQSNLSHL